MVNKSVRGPFHDEDQGRGRGRGRGPSTPQRGASTNPLSPQHNSRVSRSGSGGRGQSPAARSGQSSAHASPTRRGGGRGQSRGAARRCGVLTAAGVQAYLAEEAEAADIAAIHRQVLENTQRDANADPNGPHPARVEEPANLDKYGDTQESRSISHVAPLPQGERKPSGRPHSFMRPAPRPVDNEGTVTRKPCDKYIRTAVKEFKANPAQVIMPTIVCR